MDKKGELSLDIKNIGANPKKILATLALPRELSTPTPQVNFQMAPRSGKNLAFEIRNFSALPGADYPVFCYFEYDLANIHHTAVGTAVIKIIEPENLFRRYRWLWIAFAAVLILALFALVVKNRGKSEKRGKGSMRVIFHGDDFGLTTGVNHGIIHGYQHGLLTSTSLMAVGEAAEEAMGLAVSNPGLDVGIHLVLVDESPLLPPQALSTFVSRNGLLPSRNRMLKAIISQKLDYGQVEAECCAQVEKVLAKGSGSATWTAISSSTSFRGFSGYAGTSPNAITYHS